MRDVEETKTSRRSYCSLKLNYINDKKIQYECTKNPMSLRYWYYKKKRRQLPDEKAFLYFLGKYLKEKKTLFDLLNAYAIATSQGHIKIK